MTLAQTGALLVPAISAGTSFATAFTAALIALKEYLIFVLKGVAASDAYAGWGGKNMAAAAWNSLAPFSPQAASCLNQTQTTNQGNLTANGTLALGANEGVCGLGIACGGQLWKEKETFLLRLPVQGQRTIPQLTWNYTQPYGPQVKVYSATVSALASGVYQSIWNASAYPSITPWNVRSPSGQGYYAPSSSWFLPSGATGGVPGVTFQWSSPWSCYGSTTCTPCCTGNGIWYLTNATYNSLPAIISIWPGTGSSYITWISGASNTLQLPAFSSALGFIALQTVHGPWDCGGTIQFGYDINANGAIDYSTTNEKGPGMGLKTANIIAANGATTSYTLDNVGGTWYNQRWILDVQYQIMRQDYQILYTTSPVSNPTWATYISGVVANLNWAASTAQNPSLWNGILVSACKESAFIESFTVTTYPTGTYLRTSDLTLQPCPAGTYWGGGTQCSNCPAGMYGTGTGSSSAGAGCSNCMAGYYSSGTGSTTCTLCSYASYTLNLGTANCNITFVADYGNKMIRQLSLVDGSVTKVAGTGASSSTNGAGSSATFVTPYGMTFFAGWKFTVHYGQCVHPSYEHFGFYFLPGEYCCWELCEWGYS